MTRPLSGMLAKVCSDRNKPNGQFVLPNDKEAVMAFVRDLPIRKISGIGNVTEQLLGSIGVKTCHDLWEKRELLCLLFTECSYEYFLRVALGIGSISGEVFSISSNFQEPTVTFWLSRGTPQTREGNR